MPHTDTNISRDALHSYGMQPGRRLNGARGNKEDKESGNSRDEVSNACSGRVSSVSCSESILNKDIAKLGKLFREVEIVLGLSCSVSDVLYEHHLACLEFFRSSLYVIINDNIRRNKLYFPAGKLCYSFCDRREAEFRLWLSLWSAEVRHQNYSRSVIEKILDARKSCPDADVISDNIAIQRNVEITSHNGSFAGPVDVSNSLFHLCFSFALQE